MALKNEAKFSIQMRRVTEYHTVIDIWSNITHFYEMQYLTVGADEIILPARSATFAFSIIYMKIDIRGRWIPFSQTRSHTSYIMDVTVDDGLATQRARLSVAMRLILFKVPSDYLNHFT